MLFSHPKGNLRIMARSVHIQPSSSSRLDSLPFTRAAGCAASLYSPEEEGGSMQKDKGEGRAHNLNE